MENYFAPHLKEDDIRAISSIGLAHLGDAVYELLVRTWLCAHGKATGKNLHRAAVALVKAQSQAERGEKLLPLLTEEELSTATEGQDHLIPAGLLDLLNPQSQQLLLELPDYGCEANGVKWHRRSPPS